MKPRILRRLIREPARRARRRSCCYAKPERLASGMLRLRTFDGTFWRIEYWRPPGHLCTQCNNTRKLPWHDYRADSGITINAAGRVQSWEPGSLWSTCIYCSEFSTGGSGVPPWLQPLEKPAPWLMPQRDPPTEALPAGAALPQTSESSTALGSRT